MKITRILLIAAVCLGLAGCKCDSQHQRVRSMEVQFADLSNNSESYGIKYGVDGSLTGVERTAVSDGERYQSSRAFSYKDQDATVTLKAKRIRIEAAAKFEGDSPKITSFVVDANPNPAPNTVFYGQKWEGKYDGEALVSYSFTDITSDGTATGKLTWDEEGNLQKIESADPTTFVEIKDFEYLDEENPFEGADPVAYLLGVNDFFWQGLAGTRPRNLISSYTRVASDPWVEDVSIDQVNLSYDIAPDGRIRGITQTVDGVVQTTIKIK